MLITLYNFHINKEQIEISMHWVEWYFYYCRFPSNDLLACYAVLSMRPISLLSSEKLEEYGQKEVRTLCDHCRIAKTSKWINNLGFI